MSQHFIMQYSLYLKRDFSTFICIIGTCWSFWITSAILHGSSMFWSIRLSTVADLKQSISFWQLAICIMDCIKGQGPIKPNSRDRWQFSRCLDRTWGSSCSTPTIPWVSTCPAVLTLLINNKCCLWNNQSQSRITLFPRMGWKEVFEELVHGPTYCCWWHLV